jgi:hypothetical protein
VPRTPPVTWVVALLHAELRAGMTIQDALALLLADRPGAPLRAGRVTLDDEPRTVVAYLESTVATEPGVVVKLWSCDLAPRVSFVDCPVATLAVHPWRASPPPAPSYVSITA